MIQNNVLKVVSRL